MQALVVVFGDALLDTDLTGRVDRLLRVEDPAPVLMEERKVIRPGGAALAAALVAQSGTEVVLITALPDDEHATTLLELLTVAGVTVINLGARGSTPEKVRLRSGDRTLVRLDRGTICGPVGALTPDARAAIERADAVLVSDYGCGMASYAPGRALIEGRMPALPVVWDPQPGAANPLRSSVVTPSSAEVLRMAVATPNADLVRIVETAEALANRWDAAGVAVTLAERGALLVQPHAHPLVIPADPATATDSCGAGDMFAATAARVLASGAGLQEAIQVAVREASRFVAAGAASAYDSLTQPWRRKSAADDVAFEVASATRAQGGTVVATGGCFDIVHAGHVALLAGARRMGDCLVVCLNSDASVRRLKGAGRPMTPASDRAAVLRALDSVDAVAIFEEDTPVPLLRRLRPDIFVKGADYRGTELPERTALPSWGGRLVLLPYVPGRSTTSFLARAGSSPVLVDGDAPERLEDVDCGRDEHCHDADSDGVSE